MANITPRVKTLKVAPQKDLASVRVSDKWASITSSKGKHFVTADSGGVSIGGQLSYQGLPNQVIFGGLLTFPFFPVLFLPVGPTLVPSTALPMLAVSAAQLAKSLSGLIG